MLRPIDGQRGKEMGVLGACRYLRAPSLPVPALGPQSLGGQGRDQGPSQFPLGLELVPKSVPVWGCWAPAHWSPSPGAESRVRGVEREPPEQPAVPALPCPSICAPGTDITESPQTPAHHTPQTKPLSGLCVPAVEAELKSHLWRVFLCWGARRLWALPWQTWAPEGWPP